MTDPLVNENGAKHIGIKIGHLNVRDVLPNNKKQEIQMIFEKLNFDILGISETWLFEEIEDGEVSIPGHQIVRDDRPGISNWRKRRCRLVLYIKENWLIHSTSFVTLQGAESIKLVCNNEKMRKLELCLLYRPPKSSTNSFLSSLENLFLLNLSHESYFLGDWNIEMLKISPDSLKFKNLCSQYNFIQILKTATRNAAKTNTLIDLIVVNSPRLITHQGFIPCWISDHKSRAIELVSR